MPDFIATDRKALAKNRLEFVSIITKLKPQFEGPQHMQTFENGWTHTWQFFDSLRIYLLLTCFDLLGQPDEFRDYQSWLSSSSTLEERRIAESKLTNPNDPISVAVELHRAYLDIYGTKNSFYRFVQRVLPEKSKSELFISIMIRRIDVPSNTVIEEIKAEKEKLKYLYEIRNSFTHKGLYPGFGAAGLFPDTENWRLIDGKLMKGYCAVYDVIRGRERVEFSVRDWPDVLIRLVIEGLLLV